MEVGVEFRCIGSAESAVFCKVASPTPPEVGAGTLEASTCSTASRMRGEGKVLAYPHVRGGALAHVTGHSCPASQQEGARMKNRENGQLKTKTQQDHTKNSSCGSYFHQRIDSHQEKGEWGWAGRRDLQKSKHQKEGRKLTFKGTLISPESENPHCTQCLQKRNLTCLCI